MGSDLCERIWEAEAVHDGRLTGESQASFERHLATCAACRDEVTAVSALSRRARATRPADISALERRRQRIALLKRANDQLLATTPRSRKRFAPLAIVLVIVAFALTVFARPSARAEGDGATATRTARCGEIVCLASYGWASMGSTLANTPNLALDPLSATPAAVEAPVVASSSTTTPKPMGTKPMGNGALAAVAPSALPAPTSSSASKVESGAIFVAAMDAFHTRDYAAADPLFARFSAMAKDDARCEDAAFLRAVSHARMGDREGARTLIEAYLAAYPAGLRRAEAERLAVSLEK